MFRTDFKSADKQEIQQYLNILFLDSTPIVHLYYGNLKLLCVDQSFKNVYVF